MSSETVLHRALTQENKDLEEGCLKWLKRKLNNEQEPTTDENVPETKIVEAFRQCREVGINPPLIEPRPTEPQKAAVTKLESLLEKLNGTQYPGEREATLKDFIPLVAGVLMEEFDTIETVLLEYFTPEQWGNFMSDFCQDHYQYRY